MNRYIIKVPAKTKFLNFIRRIFTYKITEYLLFNITLNSNISFFHKLVPPNYLYDEGSFRIVNRDGLKYKLDLSHVIDHGVYFGYIDRSYESIITDFGRYQVMLDVGGNIGTSALFYDKLNPRAKIYCFEPHTATFNRAKENLQLNNNINIRLLNQGLGDKQSELKLYEVNPNNPGMNRIIKGEHEFPYTVIDIDTVDHFMEKENLQSLDFIKIDVEGFESAVLKGGVDSISKYKPVLFIELDDDNLRENDSSAREMITFINSMGYHKIYRANNLQPISSEDNFSHCHFDIIAKQN